ncbi:hypothetical protein MBM_00968 [Drepanopeziza brunnea f. sp. 'multigermtubi' MB_m1]|uniref:Uncharacterized protein n=1 Tax=Marssonina brunnea f. sp. multigermtubi (strain MB_m1) TaxID=1072389 RepID=K1X547_MARBU|nr:uncharacterized protein MBM_00968 [Drepanopeziza brunnea f. sp. 'multigermtubi' MB_m1]EKD20286.1 hypothetical protein MBM_00968 [Drepanopeziza brunnea f. sp. 'multigermtubi' MB_m1]
MDLYQTLLPAHSTCCFRNSLPALGQWGSCREEAQVLPSKMNQRDLERYIEELKELAEVDDMDLDEYGYASDSGSEDS